MSEERLDDRVAEEIKARLMHEVVRDRSREERPVRTPEPRRGWAIPVVTTVAVAVVVIGVSVAVLVAPRAPRPADPVPSSSLSSTSVPTTPAPTPSDQALVRMFGGSCGAVLPTATVADIVGEAVRKPVDATVAQAAASGAETAALYVLGGLRCGWTARAGGTDQGGLDLAAAPAALAPTKPEATACFGSSDGGATQESCSFSRTSGDVWFTGTLTTATGGEAATRAQVDRLGTALDSAAADPGASIALAARPVGSWARTTTADCAALVKGADLATALRLPGLVGQPGNGSQQPGGQLAASERLGLTPCFAANDGVSYQFAVLPGCGAVRRLVEADPTAKPVEVPGGATAVETKDDQGFAVVTVFDGANVLQVLPGTGAGGDDVLAAIAPLLRELDRTTTG